MNNQSHAPNLDRTKTSRRSRLLATATGLLLLPACTETPSRGPVEQERPAVSAPSPSAPSPFNWEREPRADCSEVEISASGLAAQIYIQQVVFRDPYSMEVEVTACPTNGKLDGAIVNVEAYNQPNDPGRTKYGQEFLTNVTIPADGDNFSFLVDTEPGQQYDPANMPSIGAGVFGGIRPDNTWNELVSNWDQVG